MTPAGIVQIRLHNQQILSTKFTKPGEIVNWLVAMQAQEFAMAKWAIGLRMHGTVSDADVEKAFNEGDILRTHLMRPTWHFVSPADIRWLIALTAPRVNAINAFMYRKMELDKKIFTRSNKAITKALLGGNQLTRVALQAVLKKNKIEASSVRLGYIMMRAELDGIICSGARQGKQFTYALLEERVPPVNPLTKDEALVLFTKRYFTSRGPATARDFAYWSGLSMKDVQAGIANLPSSFLYEEIEGKEYIFLPSSEIAKGKLRSSFLMPDYDEYGMSYKDRSAILSKNYYIGESTAYSHWLVINGRIEGTWHLNNKKNVVAEAAPFTILNKLKQQLVANGIKRYHSFVS